MPDGKTLNCGNIQGNILGGFNKDFQMLLFLRFDDPAAGRDWVAGIASDIATTEEVLAFNELFKLARARRGREGVVRATWTNVAFTCCGLQALGIPDGELQQFPEEFRQGMAARAALLGDEGPSDPSQWLAPFGTSDVHAMLIVASDLADDVDPDNPDSCVSAYIQDIQDRPGVTLVFAQPGATRGDIPGETGHEHFGFKDGVSQPGVRGIDKPSDPANPNQGDPGQDLLWPGEFVLGYETQIPTAGTNDPNTDPGPISSNGPNWSTHGSFLVFRRLRQDVPGFRSQVEAQAGALGLTPALMGAKLVGRYQSGCPLMGQNNNPVDPGIADPRLGNDHAVNNKFEYGEDPQGLELPRAGHIRKAYPRDQEGTQNSGTDSESRTQTHRFLRRGIPYGTSFGADVGGDADVDRGLLFVCYQRSINDQFEFAQGAWINDPNFPCPEARDLKTDDNSGPLYPNGQGPDPDGIDPVMSPNQEGPYALMVSGQMQRIPALKHFVTTTGGDYFFAPSICALDRLAGNP